MFRDLCHLSVYILYQRTVCFDGQFSLQLLIRAVVSLFQQCIALLQRLLRLALVQRWNMLLALNNQDLATLDVKCFIKKSVEQNIIYRWSCGLQEEDALLCNVWYSHLGYIILLLLLILLFYILFQSVDELLF